MKDINIHICPNCGGNLSVDIKRQMYECPFCGVSFDYDYFREESVLDIAAQALKNNEFTSADRAYDFLLEKEPDNFEALRGKALIAMNMPQIDYMCRVDLYSKIDYESAYKEIGRAIGSSKAQDREYFTVMKDIVDAGHEYTGEKAGLAAHKTEKKRLQEMINDYAGERDSMIIYSYAKDRPKRTVFLTVLCYLICCLLLFLGYKYYTRNPYSQAEDLSQYETTQTEAAKDRPFNKDNNINKLVDDLRDFQKYQEALEREEQRKINYDTWERNNPHSYGGLIWLLGIATVIYGSIVFILFKRGRDLDAEIFRLQGKADEQTGMIKSCEKRMDEIKAGIDQSYQRLCELYDQM